MDIHEVKHFKDKSSYVLFEYNTGITQDNEGNIWIGKDHRGLYKFDGISDDYKQIKFGELYKNRSGIYNKMIKTIYTDNTGIIWFGTFILVIGMTIGATILYSFANYFFKEKMFV